VIADHDLAIVLLVVGGGELVGDFVLGAEVRHMLACEVGSIVGDDGMRNIEATNNVLPKELHCLLSRDFGEQHRLYPLGEVVGNQEEPELGQSSWERAHYIEPPLHEGSGALQSVKVFARRERTFDIVGTSSHAHAPWRHQTSWANSTLG